MSLKNIPSIKHLESNNFFLIAGPCVVETEEICFEIAERVKTITDKLRIPYIFKASYRKANRSRLDSFTGIGDVKGLEIIEMNDVETCCGFGGTFSVKFDAISVAMADQKICNAKGTNADYIISTDLSCLMHLDGYIQNKGLSIKTIHIADVLASGWE